MSCSRRRAIPISLLAAALALTACARPAAPPTLPDLAVTDPAFAPTVEAYAGTPVTRGNRVDLLLNGDQIFPALLAAIRGARETLHYVQYSWGDGEISREVAAAFAERCRAGVRGRIVVDAVGSTDLPEARIEEMRRAGCRVHVFRPVRRALLTPRRFNNRNHRRLLVADGRVGFTGGSGVNTKWTGDGRTPGKWRDTDARIEGPAVDQLQAAFLESWRLATGELIAAAGLFDRAPARGRTGTQVVRSSPETGSDGVYAMFLLAIAGARRTIHITNPYFVPDDAMREALLRAARRGVAVTVLVPGEIDHAVVRQASRAGFGRLLEAGVVIYEYRAALLHAKTLVVDGVWATVGSTNLDNRSFAMNAEMNVAVYDQAFAERLSAVFADDLRRSRRVDLDGWRRRPLRERAIETLVLPVRDLL